jgi:CDP-diacylglycerol---glycerol-3-phosphate 3-phosphatidyltransferase
MNVVNYREDEHLFLQLLKELGGDLRLATGYLNLTKDYLEGLGQRLDKVEILTSSPRANGFYQAGRIKKYIPGIYRVNELRTLRDYPSIRLHEWEAFGWTYHAKGAWFYEEPGQVGLSVIGSSNYSHRSNRRDTECQLYVLAECANLKQRLHQEAEQLF